MKRVKISLVFDDWRFRGQSIYNTEKGVDLSMGSFHSGTMFDGNIELDESDAQQLEQALQEGYQPVFWVSESDEGK